jgi:hypothetical protein
MTSSGIGKGSAQAGAVAGIRTPSITTATTDVFIHPLILMRLDEIHPLPKQENEIPNEKQNGNGILIEI